MAWYQDPLQVVLVAFVGAGMAYLGYRLVKVILDAL